MIRVWAGVFVGALVGGVLMGTAKKTEVRREQSGETAVSTAPFALKRGPHLFVDDTLIATSRHITRHIAKPRREPSNPIITGKEDKCFQPYVTVVRDPDSRSFRMWYGVPENASQSHLAYIESEDSVRWLRPHRVLQDPAPIQFGCSVLDEGPSSRDSAQRFKYAWWRDGGLQIAVSPDGLAWKPLKPGVLLPHNHDINNLFRDPIRNRYVATISTYTTGSAWKGQRRVIQQSVSDDLLHWSKPWFVITPDAKDEGETQFYCMGGLLARGDLLIGMVRVLRDDLPADAGGPARGLGYTTLAWSHDGIHWTRDREPFLDRDPTPGAWDHAMTWVDCQLPVGDEVFLYYGGYARGHKVERFTERQIGLARMARDRYVAREAGETPGTLQTPLLTLDAQALTLNTDAAGGEARVQILNAEGQPIPGYTLVDCRPIHADAVAAPVLWKKPLSRLRNVPIRLEFALTRARLFAFDLR